MKRFYIFLLALICLSVGLEANAQVITTLPWSDDFEGGLTKWVVESDDPDYEWTVTEGNPAIYSNLKNAHSGTQNAYFFAYGYTSSLVSPVFDLSAQSDVVVSFWYSMQRYNNYRDELTLYYRKSSSDSWSELVELTSEDGKWRYMQVHLLDLSANVQFKFEGYGNEGLGILLDDITVKPADDYWTDEGNYDISWYDESGNYYLSTPEQLAGLAYLVNNETDFSDETFNLTSDIDLSGHEWVSIGNTSAGYYFDGKFNGNNHTIDNLVSSEQSFSDYYGLFGNIGGNVEIKKDRKSVV